jgi:hypothetical protein
VGGAVSLSKFWTRPDALTILNAVLRFPEAVNVNSCIYSLLKLQKLITSSTILIMNISHNEIVTLSCNPEHVHSTCLISKTPQCGYKHITDLRTEHVTDLRSMSIVPF